MFSWSRNGKVATDEILKALPLAALQCLELKAHLLPEVFRIIENGTVAEAECTNCHRTLIVTIEGVILGGAASIKCTHRSVF